MNKKTSVFNFLVKHDIGYFIQPDTKTEAVCERDIYLSSVLPFHFNEF
nr:MAG TPA: hypothetical protein [Caudoviricetes sp.]